MNPIRNLALALCSTALVAPAAWAETQQPNMPQIFTMSPMGVNLQTGAFVHSETDFTIGSLSFVRSWGATPSFQPNGGEAADHHWFGGWNHNFGFGIRAHGSTGADIYADGKVYQFEVQTNGSWVPWNLDQHNNNGFGASLTGSWSNGFVFRNQNGDVYTINADRQATRVDYADGSRIDLGYDGAKRLRTIISNRGDAIVLDYDVSGRLATACGHNRANSYVGTSSTCSGAPVGVSYGYTNIQYGPPSTPARPMLTKVTDPASRVTEMTYGSNGPILTCIRLPRAAGDPTAPCRITNSYGVQPGDVDPTVTAYNQVRVQTTATGEVWSYSYLGMSQYADWPPLQGGEIRQTEGNMTAQDGNVTHIEYENGFARRLYAPDGLTQYAWAMQNPTIFTRPGGNSENLQYDLRNNLVSRTRRAPAGSSDPDIVTSATYPASVPWIFPSGCDAASQRLCNRPITTTDERGNVTDYTYDAAHGGVLTVTRPAPTTGAVRPQTRYSYSQIYAGVRDASNNLVSASTPVWVLTEESQCITGASCAGTADEVRTLYHYGASGSADALRLRGTTVTGNGVTSRTCAGYDALGNRISETGPGAQLASCP